MKLEDLAKWAQSDFSKWKCGFRAEPVKPMDVGKNGQKEALTRYRQSTLNSGLNFKDILKEKADLGEYPLLFSFGEGPVGEHLLKMNEPGPAKLSPIPEVCQYFALGRGVVMRCPSRVGGAELIAGSFEINKG